MCLSQISIKKAGNDYYSLVNCGKCDECLAYNVQLWTNRLLLEKKNWNSIFFVTFTLNPVSYLTYQDPFLYKDFFQRMFKRMRKNLIKFKYFLVAERGSLDYRLHAHCILFINNYDILSLYNILKLKYYTDDNIRFQTDDIYSTIDNSIVKEPTNTLGFISVKPCYTGGIKYVLGYLKDPHEFRLISKGLGKLANNELYDYVADNSHISKYHSDKFKKIYGEIEFNRLTIQKNTFYNYKNNKLPYKYNKNNPKNVAIRNKQNEIKKSKFI